MDQKQIEFTERFTSKKNGYPMLRVLMHLLFSRVCFQYTSVILSNGWTSNNTVIKFS